MENNTQEKAAGPDLDALRDEKCIPIARAVLAELVEKLIAQDATPAARSFIGQSLAADLNITTEWPYIPQLLLGALSGLNVAVQSCQVVPLDDARFAVIAKQILSILSDGNVKLGSVTMEETAINFADVSLKLNALFAEERLTRLEVNYIMDSIFDAFKTANNVAQELIAQSMKKAEEKLWGVDDMSDITLQQLDKVMTTPASTTTEAVA